MINVDELILFEQKVNLLNGPVIAVQLLRVVVPAPLNGVFRHSALCVTMETAASFAVLHRAIGGLGIALVRQVRLENIPSQMIRRPLSRSRGGGIESVI